MRLFAITLCVLLTEISGGCFASCGTEPYPSNTGNVTPNPIIDSSKVWNFVSEPNLHPMKVTVKQHKSGTSPDLILVAPYTFSADATYGQPGALIWFRPLSSPNLMNTDLRVQKLNGKSVLTFWQGTLATPPTYTNVPAGSSEPGSCYYILDNRYHIIKTVTAQNGFTSDIHEFLITPYNTALFLSTRSVPMDLTPYGGPQNGYVQDFAIQEIDLQTNELLFFWDALQHIPLTDSYEPASSASDSHNIWDAYHLNSIGLTDNDTDIIVSGRNTWTVYRINKLNGSIVWRLGGKHSNFIFGNGAHFSWQHDARFLPDNTISLFDDNCCESSTIPSGTPPAHGLILELDFVNMKADVKRTYFHNPDLQVSSQGNVQSLDNGNKFIGWGQSQYYSEYKEAGNTEHKTAVNTLYNAKMPGNNYTYRAYRSIWVGMPHYPPSIAVRSRKGKVTVYASWNGSTETKTWQIYAGDSLKKLALIGSEQKSGFETAISVTSSAAYFQVKALNSSGAEIGVSKILKVP